MNGIRDENFRERQKKFAPAPMVDHRILLAEPAFEFPCIEI